MIDKLSCDMVLRWWCHPIGGDSSAMSADRNVFNRLRQKSVPGETKLVGVFYTAQPHQVLQADELALRVAGQV